MKSSGLDMTNQGMSDSVPVRQFVDLPPVGVCGQFFLDFNDILDTQLASGLLSHNFSCAR